MRNRSHLLRAVVLCLVAIFAVAPMAESAGAPRRAPIRHDADDRKLVEMDPARAAQEALAPIVPGPPGRVEIEIATPGEGAIFSDAPVAHLYGRLAALGQTGRVDAVIVIDTSASTQRRAERRDRAIERMRGRYDPWKDAPSILAHEIRSAELLMEELDPRETRLAIVTFAGVDEGQPYDAKRSARTEVALTGRYEALDAGLQRVARRGAAGQTDMATALDRAVAELTGRGRSRPARQAAKVVIFLTDGTPTLPRPTDPDANERAVFAAAERAARAGVRVFSFAIGPEALSRPAAAAEMARRTDGVYTPVRRPTQLAEAVTRTVEFESVGGQLSVRNATLRANARDLHVGEDGIFGGIVPLRPGKNTIRVRAVAGRRSAEAVRVVHYAPGSVAVFRSEHEILPVPTAGSHRELELTAGQRRTIDITLGDGHVRKEIDIGLGRR
ncbi:MAG TPA: vWA domain-containing protein [Myxococcota bacterium]|nr:vWA domain-containing protein [Myxococcota bacterium]